MTILEKAAEALELAGAAAMDLSPQERVKVRLEVARGFRQLAAIEQGLLTADLVADAADLRQASDALRAHACPDDRGQRGA